MALNKAEIKLLKTRLLALQDELTDQQEVGKELILRVERVARDLAEEEGLELLLRRGLFSRQREGREEVLVRSRWRG